MTINWLRLIPRSIRSSIAESAIEEYKQQTCPQSSIVVIAGWPASGSTFLFQGAKRLGLDVQKVHGAWQGMRLTPVFFTIRDPRDILCAMARRLNGERWESAGLEQALIQALDLFVSRRYIEDFYASVRQPNVIIVRYETYFLGNEQLLLRMVADQFGIAIDPEVITNILKDISIEANIERSKQFTRFVGQYDEDSGIHGKHITNRGRPGAWRDTFTDSVAEAVKNRLGRHLIALGYQTGTDWFGKSTSDSLREVSSP
jgi:hypothetical protein